LATTSNESTPWIFVSHASADLHQVRRVRNYLEDKGASPLLFHLKGLTQAQEFWPLIEREIRARNFFLYCESEAAERSEWVQREREVVEMARRERPIRVSQVRVDTGDLDWPILDSFLSRTRVFVNYADSDSSLVEPFVTALKSAGFVTFDAFVDVPLGARFEQVIMEELRKAAAEGWVVMFLNKRSLESAWVEKEILFALSLGGKFVPVLLESATSLAGVKPGYLQGIQWLDTTRYAVPQAELVRILLTR
jgi:hypothetical protein